MNCAYGRCEQPSSPSAWRADLTRLATAKSEMIRPSQIRSMSSSLVTKRSRFSTTSLSSAKTCGSIGIATPLVRSSNLAVFQFKVFEKIDHREAL